MCQEQEILREKKREKQDFRHLRIICKYFLSDKYYSYSYSQIFPNPISTEVGSANLFLFLFAGGRRLFAEHCSRATIFKFYLGLFCTVLYLMFPG